MNFLRCCITVVLSMVFFCAVAQQLKVNSATLIKQGADLYAEGKYKEAARAYDKVPRSDTNYDAALIGLSYSYYADSNYAASIKYTELGIKFFPERADQWYNMMANNLEITGKVTEALEYYNKIIKQYNNAYIAYFNIGIAYFKQKKWGEAKKNFQQAVLINPYYAPAHYHLGKIAYEEGDMVTAMLCYTTNLLVSPDNKLSSISISNLSSIAKVSDDVVKKAEVFKPYTGSNFDEIQEILLGKIALDNKYKIKADLEDPIVRQLQMIFEKLEYKSSDNSFVMQYYIPLYTEALKDERFEPMMYFIFSSIEQPYIEKYVKRNKKKIEDLVTWFAPYLNSIRATQELISAKRKDIKERIVFDDGLPWGKGVMEGEGKSQVLTGTWEFYYPNGALKSKGIFNEKQERKGEWAFYFKSGKIKEKTNYKDGKAEGKSVVWYGNGSMKSEETFKDDKLDGKATNYYYNGMLKSVSMYKGGVKEGNFTSQTSYNTPYSKGGYKNDKEDGEYTYYFNTGKIASKEMYTNGESDGPYKKYYANGQLSMEGFATKSKRSGNWKEYHRNGKLSSTYSYTEGKLDGEYKEYHYNGQLIASTTYANGKLEGSYKNFDSDGKLYCESMYEKDRLKDIKFFDKEGKIISSSSSRNGSGNLTFFDARGNKTSEGYFTKEGLRSGKTTFYYRNGKIKSVANYKEGLLNGEKISYFSNGTVSAKSNYINDEEDGYEVSYFINGNKSHEGEVIKGAKEGLHIDYTYLGQVYSKSDYKEGDLDGYVEYYHPSGKLDFEVHYVSGWETGITQYDTTGKIISDAELPEGNVPFTFKNYNGDKYVTASYKNHYMNGEHSTFYTINKPNRIQHYKYGIKDSTYTSFFFDGKIETEGKFNMGDKDGKWSYFHSNGKLYYNQVYDLGQQNSTIKMYQEDGTLDKEINYAEDEFDGEYKIYGDNNNLALVLIYSEGTLTGYSYEDKTGKLITTMPLKAGAGKIVSYYKNGTKSAEFDMEEDEVNGTRNVYSSTGKPYIEGKRLVGYDHGPKKVYYNTGQLEKEENYYYGTLHGTVKCWWENGKSKSEEMYYNGEKHGIQKFYDNTGKLIQTLTYYYGILQSIK